jgi:hypothetical protein
MNPFLIDLGIKNGAVSALRKKTTPGDVLDRTILHAVSTMQPNREKEPITSSLQLDFLKTPGFTPQSW